MSKIKYTHVQTLWPEIKAMLAAGKTQREVAEHFGFEDKYVIKGLLKRHRENYSVREMCRFFQVSHSGYYDFVNRLGNKENN